MVGDPIAAGCGDEGRIGVDGVIRGEGCGDDVGDRGDDRVVGSRSPGECDLDGVGVDLDLRT